MAYEIEPIVEHFRNLLQEQCDRAHRLAKEAPAVDYSTLDNIVIGACPGDGIGPIIFREAVRVLNKVLEEPIAAGKITIKEIDGLTLENRIAWGQAVPDDVLSEIKSCNVILKGPTTTPQAGSTVKNIESANVALRRELDLFANVRPVNVPELGIDWTFFRENTEGEYAMGSKGAEIPDTLAVDFKVTTDAGTRRIAKAAFEYARANGKTRMAIVTKANILKKTDGKFSTICKEIAKDYPEITAEEWYVDIMSANLINPELQSKFQVFVLPNLYGDIITDEAAQLQGGVGTAGSANIGNRYAMFEAIHGSAPRMIEAGIQEYADPRSIMKAAVMLLNHIGYQDAAKRFEDAITAAETEGTAIVTGTPEGATCTEFTDCVLKHLL